MGSDDSTGGEGAETRTTVEDAQVKEKRRAERWFMRRMPRRPWGRLVVVALFIAAVFGVVAFGLTSANLDCGETQAMVRLELAGSSERAGDVLQEKDADGDVVRKGVCTESEVRDALWWDIPFIAGYGALLAVGALAFGAVGYRMGRFRRLAVPMAAGAVATMVLDGLENTFLLLGVDREPVELFERHDFPFVAAATFSWAKWLVLGVVLAYAVTALVGYLLMPAWILKLRSGLADREEAERVAEVRGDEEQAERDEEEDQLAEVQGIPRLGDATSTAPRSKPEPGVKTGIALSGGGVRSATFALGGMQALDGSGRGWNDVQQVTSVSGGGYMSGAWALTRGDPKGSSSGTALEPFAEPEHEQRRAGVVSAEEKYLRQHLGYLLEAEHNRPGGLPTLLIGLIVNIFSLLVLVYLFARPFGWMILELVDPGVARAYQPDQSVSIVTAQWAPVVFWLSAGAVLLLGWVLYSRIRRARRPGYERGLSAILHPLLKWAARAGLALGLVLLLVLVVAPALMILVPQQFYRTEDEPNGGIVGTLSTIAGLGVFASVRQLLVDQASKWATKLGGVLLALIVVLLGGWWATSAAVAGPRATVWSWVVVLVVVVVGLIIVSPEWWSMAPFYRGRLRRAYAINTRNEHAPPVAFTGHDEPMLGDMKKKADVPLARYCCALNVRDSQVKTLAGIPALSFTMDAKDVAVHHVDGITGAPTTWTCTPDELDELMAKRRRTKDNEVKRKGWTPRVTPMLAVATSGAAVSSAMGRLGKGTTNALLAFANVRLGVWLPHPRWAGQNRGEDGKRDTSYPRVRMSYLLKEVFGLFDFDDLHVYVTDGAHWEGTAIVELFRDDDIAEAIAFDAGGAGAASLVSPAEVLTLSNLELFDDIAIDVEPLRAADDGTRGGGLSERVATVGLVRGIAPDGTPTVGVLWYARNVVATGSSARLKAYAERFETFPSVSTINQFFDDEKFQNYRLLGFEAGQAIREGRKALHERMDGNPTLAEFRTSVEAALDDEKLRDDVSWSEIEMKRMIKDDDEYQIVRATVLAPSPQASSTATAGTSTDPR